MCPDPIEGWVNIGGSIWEAPWDHDFGYYQDPDSYICGDDGFEGWMGCLLEKWVPNPDSGQYRDAHTLIRREHLFQGEQRLRQLGDHGLVPYVLNSFAVPMEGSGTIRVRTTLNPNVYPIYYSECQYLFRAHHIRGVELHNLEFAYGSSFIKNGMVDIALVEKVHISDCMFRNGNSYGLSVRKTPARPLNPDDPDSWYIDYSKRPPYNLIENVRAHDNGIYGILVAHALGVELRDAFVDSNNWRGFEAGTVGYDAGGLKFFRCRHIRVADYEGVWNYGHGLWFDKDGRDIELEHIRCQFNYFRGVFMERCFGPVHLNHIFLSHNNLPVDDPQIARFRPSELSFSAVDSLVMENSIVFGILDYPVLILTLDYFMEDGVMEPYADMTYYYMTSHHYKNVLFNKPDTTLTTWFTFGAAPRLSRCYYFYHARFEECTFKVLNVEVPKYWFIAEGNRNCWPIWDGFEYDLPKFYDSPWIEPEPEHPDPPFGP